MRLNSKKNNAYSMNHKPLKADVDAFRSQVDDLLDSNFNTTFEDADKKTLYRAISLLINQQLCGKESSFNKKRKEIEEKENNKKKIYYISMEFLMGQSLKNNLYNLGETEIVEEILKERGFKPSDIYDVEPDAGLGNGGLGRLSACFMDALATGGYDATGFSIRYEYGLFKQKIIDGWQAEMPDNWLPGGRVWLNEGKDDAYTVKYYGNYSEYQDNGQLKFNLTGCDEVEALPYDMYVSGADSDAVAQLRLWRATANNNFDMESFNKGDFTKAAQENTKAELISKVLYPADNNYEGKSLRLKQQYFMVSSSCQNIVADHMKIHRTLDNFADKVAIHINDTHPALCIPELMRIFMDEYGCSWDYSWYRVINSISYTNHTVLAEALEKWPEDMIKSMLPRIYAIIKEIDRRFHIEAENIFPGDEGKINYMAPMSDSYIHMAKLSVIGSHRVNGVSRLHSEILKNDLFHDFYLAWPEKFTNVTNGIAYRRWLCQSNPGLATLLDSCIGPEYRKDASQLEKFSRFAADENVLQQLETIKRSNKAAFSDKVRQLTGIAPDPDSLYITQAKRLHEYKRQLLNALRIISRYQELLLDPDKDMTPETYFFAAKTAPNYFMAKFIIQLIVEIGNEINKNPKIAEKMRVIFLENYSVSMAESLMPATEISEQISLAGKEASGTGNMKMMINGAVTIGTMDGANVEMYEVLSSDNIFIFGQDVAAVERNLASGYDARLIYDKNKKLKDAVDSLKTGFNGVQFENLYKYLLDGSYTIADPYMCLEDFDDYCRAHDDIQIAYADRKRWNTMSLMNIAKSGCFSADRSIKDYADRVWHTKPIL